MDLLFSNFSHVGNAIGWMLIHFLWQGSLLFLGYWIITRLLLKNKINTQYWVGIIFISLCLIIPIREFFIQLGNSSNPSVFYQIGISLNAAGSGGILNPTDMFISLVQKLIPYLVIIWMISVFLISTHLIKSWLSLIKLSKEPSMKLPENLSLKLKQATNKLKLKFKPLILISKKIDIPATFGYFKPIVLLPVSLINKLPQDQMEAILLHELCHIKRADFLHNIMQLLVETLFFYHPLTKWISRDIRKIREQCCDELVLDLNTNPLVYAKALTNIASIYNSNTNAKLHIQIAANDGELFNRIKFLMINKRSKSPFTNVILGLFFAAFALFIFNSIVNETNGKNTPYTDSISQSRLVLNNQKDNRPNYVVPNIYNFINQDTKQQEQTYYKEVSNHNKKSQFSTPAPSIISPQIESTAIASIDLSENDLHEKLNANLNDFIDDENDFEQNKEPTIAVAENILPEKTYPKRIKKLHPNLTKQYPILVRQVNPNYGLSTRLSGAQGTVILSFNIDGRGRVKKIIVDKKSKLKILDSISKQALRRWRFDPNSVNEYNINDRYQQIFRFSLEDRMLQCSGTITGSRINHKQICQKD